MPKTIQGLSYQTDGETPQLFIYDDIGPGYYGLIDAVSVIEALRALGSADTIAVHINSPGGDVFEAAAIYAALQRQPSKIEVHVDGLAASAASVIAMAGDSIEIAGNALLMIHNAFAITAGNAKELSKMIETLNKVDQTIIDTYAERTKGKSSRAQIVEWMDAETWMDASEAVARGFADTAGALQQGVAASVPAGRFRNTPQQVVTSAASARRQAPPAEVPRAPGSLRAKGVPAIAARIKQVRRKLDL